MWIHLELKGQGYAAARVGVAVAGRPEGPYTFLRSFRPDAGHEPQDITVEERARAGDAAVREAIRGLQFTGGPEAGPSPYPLWARDLDGGQSTYILPVPGRRDACIVLFDLWRPGNASDGRYLWQPMTFHDDRFTIAWRERWDLSVFDACSS